ncbi:MAG TPA: PEP-CTERM sorting domain-containing protein [Gemmataceae bacterium]|jgi:MYXO-CTERM domain-containing protein
MSIRYHVAVLAVVALAQSAHAGPISVMVNSSNLYFDPANPYGSHFDGNPNGPDGWPSLETGPFHGVVYSYLPVIAFNSQADFDARHDTAVDTLPARRISFFAVFNDGAGQVAEARFDGTATGWVSATDSRLDIAFDTPSQQVTLGSAVIDVAMTARPYQGVPAVVSINGITKDLFFPLPTTTDLVADIRLAGPSGPGPIEPGGGPAQTPEPASLALAVVGVGVVALRRRRRGGK